MILHGGGVLSVLVGVYGIMAALCSVVGMVSAIYRGVGRSTERLTVGLLTGDLTVRFGYMLNTHFSETR